MPFAVGTQYTQPEPDTTLNECSRPMLCTQRVGTRIAVIELETGAQFVRLTRASGEEEEALHCAAGRLD